MQIVIDIPKGAYEEIVNAKFPVQDAYRLVAWIKDGIPLPKGHRYSDYHPFWCPLVKISNEYQGRLIRFNDIQIITAPIAPIFKGDKVHYEGIAFLNQILEIPPVQAIPVTAVEEMKRKIKEHNEFSRDEIDEMYMRDVLKIIDECCGITEADKAESEEV